MNLETVLVKRADLLSSGMDEDTVMFDLNSGRYFGMDVVGSAIWSRLKDPVRVSDLCDLLQQEFDVDQETCERDVLAFLDELLENQLVQVCS